MFHGETERHIDEQRYIQAVQTAKSFWQRTPIPKSDGDRRLEIQDLLARITGSQIDDVTGKSAAALKTTELLRGDPFSDQQAGILDRVLKLEDIHYEQIVANSRKQVLLNTEEIIDLQAGNWSRVEEVFQEYPERRAVWQGALSRLAEGEKMQTVYRGMQLHKDDVPLVCQYGIVAQGLWQSPDVEALFTSSLFSLWGLPWLGRFAQSSDYEYVTARTLLMSKGNLLRDVHWGESFNIGSSTRLGISTTTEARLQRVGSGERFYGNYLFEIKVPASNLVRTAEITGKAFGEDERTIFYYIPPEAITAYCVNSTHSTSSKDLFSYFEANKQVLRRDFLGKWLCRI
ncbi:hypothetical protein M1563_04430 [Patescibacteria group bacterium]|nr:hypothetical protein [Patescibacteria group bacterium]